jgi:hypothetical protein
MAVAAVGRGEAYGEVVRGERRLCVVDDAEGHGEGATGDLAIPLALHVDAVLAAHAALPVASPAKINCKNNEKKQICRIK